MFYVALIYSSSQIQLNQETYITLAVIAWTYLLHAYYGNYGVACRYYGEEKGRKRYDRTQHGAYKH